MILISSFFLLLHLATCLSEDPTPMSAEAENHDEFLDECRKYSDRECGELSNMCLKCDNYNARCTYGNWSTVICSKKPDVPCRGNGENIQKLARCVFCYQTEKWEHTCVLNQNQPCSSQTKYYRANCTVKPEVMCLGPRKFVMKLRCNITKGHKWSTALMLSITLGGFGADRFYLGHWQEGIGKLFSFGGLGVWTLVDVLLIAIRYLGPADGSLYV